ncbi:MAG: hypothetical protein WCI73_00110 [Phycisphaerae bacterium]
MTTTIQTNWKALGLSYEPRRGAYKRLGYYRRKDGKVIKKTFYLGRDPLAAYREKEKLEAQWKKIRAEAKELSRLIGVDAKPLWNKAESIEEMQEQGRFQDFPPGVEDPAYEEEPPLKVLTMAEAQRRFFENYHERMGLAGRRGIIQNTYNSMARLLPTALAPIPANIDLSKLTYRDFEKFCNHWCRKPNCKRGTPCADRTVHDSLRRSLQFFDWLENRPDLTFQMPKGARRLMKDSMQGLNSPSEFEYFTLDELKVMMADAPNRTKLYMLIALNTGHLNVDNGPLATIICCRYGRSSVSVSAAKPVACRPRDSELRNRASIIRCVWPQRPSRRSLFSTPKSPHISTLAFC